MNLRRFVYFDLGILLLKLVLDLFIHRICDHFYRAGRPISIPALQPKVNAV